MQGRPSWPLDERETGLADELDVLAELVRAQEGRSTPIKDTLEARLALLYVIRGSRSLEAIATLMRSGYAQEAAALARAIWEDAVALGYLSEWPSDRAVQWVEFAKRRAERVVQSEGSPGGQSWWAGTGPMGMAKELTGDNLVIAEEFGKLYWRLCDDTHGSPASAVNYVVAPADEDELPPLLVGPSNHRVKEMAMLAALGASRLAEVAERLGVKVDLAAVHKQASPIMDAYNTQ